MVPAVFRHYDGRPPDTTVGKTITFFLYRITLSWSSLRRLLHPSVSRVFIERDGSLTSGAVRVLVHKCCLAVRCDAFSRQVRAKGGTHIGVGACR